MTDKPASLPTAPQDRSVEPATVSPLAALSALDAKLERWGSEKDWPAAPWSLSVGGREWAVATDGHALLAVHRELVTGNCAVIPERAVNLARKWLEAEQAQPITVAASDLQAFTSVPADHPLCVECDGEGKVDCKNCDGAGSFECECHCGDTHERDCEKCRGTGERKCPECKGEDTRFAQRRHAPGLLLGALVNRRILASVVTMAQPDEPVTISLEPLPGFLLRGATWCAVVMSLRNEGLEPEAVFDAGDTKQAVGHDPVERTKDTSVPLTTSKSTSQPVEEVADADRR